MKNRKWVLALAAAILAASLPLMADEGMWLFDQFPKAALEKKYGFKVTDEFLTHLRLSAVRFNSGGTGSFVSPSGLLFTNHHVGADCIQKISDSTHNYMSDGFTAANLSDERKCPDLEVNVLLKTEVVTDKVQEGVSKTADPAAANKMRKANMSRLEKDCNTATGNRCDVVTFYAGGEYQLYQYKKYTDIRLVFAPEEDIAFFGGDPDNFEYPRYDLDITFFRAYENDKPVKPLDYFRFSKEGVKDGELIFTSGNPGTTGRLATMAELEFTRDTSFPLVLARLDSLIRALDEFGSISPENKRIMRENRFGQSNSQKAYIGFDEGLKDPALMAKKKSEEQALRADINKDPAKREEFGKVWDDNATAYAQYAKFYKDFYLLERNATRGSELLGIARAVARYSVETKKPNADRLREYSEAGLPSLEQGMYSDAPIYPSMEIAVLTDYFQFLVKNLGPDDPTVKTILAGKSPKAAAEGYVNTSKLMDIAERKRLANDPAAVQASTDGMIRLALILDVPARKLRKQYEDKIESVLTASSTKIAQARFAVKGTGEYPDATFTLRVSYGKVMGYKTAAGASIPYATNFAGLYEHGKSDVPPFQIPPRWKKTKSALTPSTPFNFVATADIHGGNSGSATLDSKGEVVGIVFDSNIEGLPNRYVYTETQARSVHVASQGIAEALRKVYGATRVLQELGF
jgi:hypothetical protein